VKRRIVTVSLLILLFVSVFMPIFSVYPHASLSAEIATAFPGAVTGMQLILNGNAILPLSLMPALSAIPFRENLLAAGMLLACLGAVLSLFHRRGIAHAAALFGGAGMLLLLLFSFYFQQLQNSILFDVMLTSKWLLWAPLVLSVALFAVELLQLRGVEPLPVTDRGWRVASAVFCGLALITLVFPFADTYVQAGTFPTAAEDALAARTVTGWQWLTAREPLLKELGSAEGLFTNVTGGGAMQDLVTLSDSSSIVRNLFMIPTNNGAPNGMAIAAAALLLAGIALQLIRRVDRWIPASITVVAGLMIIAEVLGMFSVDNAYQFTGATRQMMYLGLGGYTVFPLLMASAAAGAGACSVLGIRRADSPYFINPIPQKKRLLTISLFLAAVALVLLATPVLQVNLYTPGKINQSNPTVSKPMSGLALISFRQPEELMNPVSSRGKVLYGEEAAKNGLTLADVNAIVAGALRKAGILMIITLLVSALGVVLLAVRKRNKRLIVTVLLLGALLQGVTAVAAAFLLPKEVGFATALAPLYIAMGCSVFAAFFAGFLDYEELPKKFKLFLMILPFLVAVFLFAYLPLSGWRYAFYNYKLGIPMDQQEYVGFKWFTSLWANAAQKSETIRVLRNTFAMSGLGLAFSWLPVAFAIFLTEIRVGWFKKFVQIFTTLPNFISWVLVFSFALSIFSLDTGIVNKALLQVGLIQEPIAYLNSSEHIWFKMFLWNTWKTLGWGAIMYLAAIAGIDQELYEAAKVDGAGRWRQIRHITIPGILPTFFVLLLLQISNIVNNGMEQYLVFQNAMNKSTIEVLDLYVYNISLGTRSTNTISMATAIGILKSLVSIVLLFLANRFSKAVRGESIV